MTHPICMYTATGEYKCTKVKDPEQKKSDTPHDKKVEIQGYNKESNFATIEGFCGCGK